MNLMPTNETVSANVRAAMQAVGMTQIELAQHIGLHQGRLSDRLRNRTPWKLDEVTKAAAALAVPLDQLLATGEPAA